MFSEQIQKQNCPIKLIKIGYGKYLFGSKKINAQIKN